MFSPARFYFFRALACWCLLSVSVPGASLQWENGTGFRSAAVLPPKAHGPGFSRLGPETGVLFTNTLSAQRYTTNQIYLNGSGVAAGDVDGDGLCDFILAGLDGPNALFHNRGNWIFENIADQSGVALNELACTGAVLADLDGDGDLDLVINTIAQGTHVLFNDGKGHFTRVAVLNPNRAGMSLAVADIDGDGDLDFYVANYRTSTIRDEPNANLKGEYVNGKPVPVAFNGRSVTNADLVGRFTFSPTGKIIEHGEVDALYRNDGGGKFTPLSFTDGTFTDENGKPLSTLPFDWGLSCMFYDINGDGAPDLYVCNDFESPDRIWINNGKGQFRAAPFETVRHSSMFSMGVDFADINRDGYADFFVADMLSRKHPERMLHLGQVPPYTSKPGEIENRPQYSQNTVFLNRGDNSFAEISWFSHLEASEWSWSPVFIDVDLDGYEDLLVTTGHQLEMMNTDVINEAEVIKSQKKMSRSELLELKNMFKRMNTPNFAFRNNRNLTFSEVGTEWGFNEAAVSHGIALADLDNDGDLDLIVNNLNSSASLYRNESSAPRVAVRLKGAAANTKGIGASIKLLGGPVEQMQQVISGGRYLSSDEAVRVFAAGTNGGGMTIQVTWRSGKLSRVENVQANRIYEIDESGALAAGTPVLNASNPTRKSVEALKSAAASPLFEDVSSLLGHTHADEAFEDFQRQPLLPMKLSQLGPGVAWHDFDHDGLDDLAIGGGRGGKFAIYHNNGKAGFAPVTEQILQRTLARDQTTVLGIDSSFIAGSANWEDGATNGGWARIYDLQRKAAGEIILGPEASTGPLAMADIDGDGRLDLFIGGRAMAGRYPEAATSVLLRNEGGRFLPKQRFEKLGVVSGAVFSDIDNDGHADLLLACHWGPIRVFRNDKGNFTEMTEELGLADYRGFWNGIATGDFDGDGRLDIIASNWGLNTRYAASKEYPLKIYYGNFGGNPFTDLVEARFDPDLKKEVPERNLRMVGMALPWVQEKMKTYEAYGKAGVQDIYGEKLKQSVEVTSLTTTLFLNRSSGARFKFEAHPLPAEAQLTPAFGICVGDLDGDGNEDVFLSQNFFATNPETPRSDAGRGLMLRGDGKGGLVSIPGQESGIAVYGEQRGCALSDYDQDGRTDLVVAQNAGPTKLYRNRNGKQGLRIRLEGPPGNSSMIGAKLRLQFGNRLGPVREVQSGSGYWSQNSPVQVLGYSQFPTGLVAQLPNGRIVTNAIASGATEVTLGSAGEVKR